jgi:hypothetical protein
MTRWPCAALVVALLGAVFASSIVSRPTARAEDDSDSMALYLDQALPLLADARANLESLSFYLPLGSVDDANDPTWTLASQSAESLRDDAEGLQALSPPTSLSSVNDQLIDVLRTASENGNRAVDELSAGQHAVAENDVAQLETAISVFDRARSSLPSTADSLPKP